MLKQISLTDLGPASAIDLTFAERLNVVTGDNGLGKSFVLEVAWWALTRQWAGLPAWPSPAHRDTASIAAKISKKTGGISSFLSRFDATTATWSSKAGRPYNPGLVLYARVNGGFAVWDPARNYYKNAPSLGVSEPDRPAAYVFEPIEVWDGLRQAPTLPERAATKLPTKVACRGLIEDWVTWQDQDGDEFSQLKSVLRALSPHRDEVLAPGEPVRIDGVDDARRIPTIQMPYGEQVPAHFVSAGVRRVMALAYLLVWSWQEHLRACTSTKQKPAKRIVLLVDEIEAHLHPRWQRRVLRALLAVMQGLPSKPRVQVVAATHSPLVLASLEPLFDPDRDTLWAFEMEGGQVHVRQPEFHPEGDVNNWLVSDIFDLDVAGSEELERAVERAKRVMRKDRVTKLDVARVDKALREAKVPPDSELVLRWSYFKRGRRTSRTR